jgi:hypothetical protein
MALSAQEFTNYARLLNQASLVGQAALGNIYRRLEQELKKSSLDFSERNKAMVKGLQDIMPALVDKYGDAAASLSASLYETLRKRELGGDYTAVLAEHVDPIAIQQSTADLTGGLWDPTRYQAPLLALDGLLDRHVKNQSRFTMMRNAVIDPAYVQISRVPTGAKTCSVCLELARQGAVYATKKAVGQYAHFHDHCDCMVMPTFNGEEAYQGYTARLTEYSKSQLEISKPLKPIEVSSDNKTTNHSSKISIVHYSLADVRDAAERAIRLAPQIYQDVYDIFSSGLRFGNVNFISKKGGAAAQYNPISGLIDINCTNIILGDFYSRPMITYFHEAAHSFDYAAAMQFPTLSMTYLLGTTTRSEVETWKNTKQRSLLRTQKTVTDDELNKALNDKIMAFDDNMQDIANLLDLMDGAVGHSKQFPVGHPKKYWKDRSSLDTEVMAEMYSDGVINPHGLEYHNRIIPKATKAFLEMLRYMVGKYSS